MKFASLINVVPTNGEGGLASAGSLFPFDSCAGSDALKKIIADFPQFAPQILVTLAMLSTLRTVTPRRLCACGCGASVTGKARLYGADCRKRVQRERDAARIASGDKQFKLLLQAEIGSPLPPVRAREL